MLCTDDLQRWPFAIPSIATSPQQTFVSLASSGLVIFRPFIFRSGSRQVYFTPYFLLSETYYSRPRTRTPLHERRDILFSAGLLCILKICIQNVYVEKEKERKKGEKRFFLQAERFLFTFHEALIALNNSSDADFLHFYRSSTTVYKRCHQETRKMMIPLLFYSQKYK